MPCLSFNIRTCVRLLLFAAAAVDVSISKSPGSVAVPIAGTASYTITVANVGSQAASNVVVTENLPPGLQYVSGPPGER
jgi:uncharacterized repeat protein (TIGR01451 family)